MAEQQQFFTELEQVARYLNLSLPEFLAMRARGRFGVTARAKDPTPVYFKSDLDTWSAAGRPACWLTLDPAGVSRKVEVQHD